MTPTNDNIPCRCGQGGAQCMLHNPPFPFLKPTNTTPEWEMSFDDMEKNHGWIPEHKERVKSFIRTLLASHGREIRERVENKRSKSENGTAAPSFPEGYVAGWNAALDQVKGII